jgi:hypothetical protein
MSKLIWVGLVIMLLALRTGAATADTDPLSCAPGTEQQRALAICAIAYGGCAIASKIIDGSDEKKLAVGEACSAIAGQVTGQGYSVRDFLGAAVAEGIDEAADNARKDNP